LSPCTRWAEITQKQQPRPRIGARHFAKRLDKRDEPVEKLFSDLDAAFGVGGALAASLPSIMDQRIQFVAALRAVERFLMDVDWVHAERFAVWGEAIEDSNVGAQHALLAPIKKTARIPSQIWRARTAVVCAIEFLSLVGVKLEDAVKQILHHFPAIENLARPDRRRNTKPALIKAILEWRKTVHAPSRHKPNAVTEVLQSHDEFMRLEYFEFLCLEEANEKLYWCIERAEKCLQYADKIARSELASTSSK